MPWIYSYYEKMIRNDDLKVAYRVSSNGNELELTLLEGTDHGWSAQERIQHRKLIYDAIDAEGRRRELESFVASKGSYRQAAKAIENRVGQEIPLRTIQSWLLEPHFPSSRNCPPWAVNAIRDIKTTEANSESIIPNLSATYIQDRALEFAEQILEKKEYMEKKWNEIKITDLPNFLLELKREVKKLEEWNHHLSTMIHIFRSSIRKAANYEELRSIMDKKISDNDVRADPRSCDL